MISAPLQLECLEFRRVLEGGVSGPLLMMCADSTGLLRPVVVKLRHPLGHDGHHEGTSLACELVCSVIARAGGVPVPDYAIVQVGDQLPDALVEPQGLSELLARNVGPNFGTLYHEGMVVWNPGYEPRSDLLLGALEDVLAFDAAIINGDRRRTKPNLLWQGERILAVDHSLAIPVHRWTDEELASSPIWPDSYVHHHCTYEALLNRRRGFDGMFGRWQSQIETEDLVTLRDWVPPEWEKQVGDLDRIFKFLGERPRRFLQVTRELRRIMR